MIGNVRITSRHYFVLTGKLYDSEGNRRKWWSNSTLTNFQRNSRCLEDQYANFTFYGNKVWLTSWLNILRFPSIYSLRSQTHEPGTTKKILELLTRIEPMTFPTPDTRHLLVWGDLCPFCYHLCLYGIRVVVPCFICQSCTLLSLSCWCNGFSYVVSLVTVKMFFFSLSIEKKI